MILAGETGSGKTTQIPKLCLLAGRGDTGRIACTQPRRVAALSLSRRVAHELGVPWGKEVGSKVRFHDDTSPQTLIKFLTDGMLLAEAQGDPLLREYDTIVVDEAHERSLNIDFLLGHLRQLKDKRPELRIVITSATIDTEAFSRAFDNAPVIIVEGRTFPVEVIYQPLDSLGSDAVEGDERQSRSEALHYIDGAVEAVRRVVESRDPGDILVFMPSERDIRETCDLLDGRRLPGCEVVPLFGRLSAAEQQRIFEPSQRRRIVVATNIAETSLTLPGVRFVVDTGLVRLSRYSPQSRTRRLPIEPISQSSADQRKGRSGRVSGGVCIRLYSEEDYLSRPRFTQPEIQRANLADVILRLKSSGLGDVERFPFIDPPSTKAVRAGYALLEELGALEPVQAGSEGLVRPLTPLGAELARLPVDPTVARMILQARSEKALEEVLVIASGLSVQDPRERPFDKQTQADNAHRRFVHPESDFLTLLTLWDAYHGDVDTMSQGKLRRFCKDHFLSYTRMREWRDVHTQLVEVLRDRDDFRMTSVYDGVPADRRYEERISWGKPAYRAIHRSVLTGLLGNVARRDEESGGYKAPHDRKVVIFPGSSLFPRRESRKPSADKPEKRKESKAPAWIVAAEITETTRLYARTCARIDPQWIVDLASHIIRVSHSDPFWNPDMGRVLVKQKSRLYGLEIDTRSVGYGRIDPRAATEIFIREGLVADTVTWPFDFIAHNRRLREKMESILTRTRDSAYQNIDEGLYRFYADRITGVSSVPELIELVRERRAREPNFLMLELKDLRDPDAISSDAIAYPEAVPLENKALPLNYAYKPGESDDGVSIQVPIEDLPRLTAQAVDWAVPAHLELKVDHYLRALPKDLRRSFIPLAESARRLAGWIAERDRLTQRRETIAEALAAEIRERLKLPVSAELWEGKPPPDHLRVRICVVDKAGGELASGRELAEVERALSDHVRAASHRVAHEDPDLWQQARVRWERGPQVSWGFGSIPASVPVTEKAGMTVSAFPGLVPEAKGVALRLFRTEPEAERAHAAGVRMLVAETLRYELGWLERDLRGLSDLGPLISTLAPVSVLRADLFESARYWLCSQPGPVRTQEAFSAALLRAREGLRGLVPRTVELLREVLSLRQSLLVAPHPYPGLEDDLARLVGADFLRVTPFGRLADLPRYLKGMRLRSERWRQNPAKDQERARSVAPFAAAVASGRGGPEFRWLVEEFRISLFAQELGTAESVSAVKLERVLSGRSDAPPAQAAAPAPEPPRPAIAPPTGTKRAPIKTLGSLDKLFPR